MADTRPTSRREGDPDAQGVLPLTERQVRSAKPREKFYTLHDGGSLSIEIMPTGSKIWRMRFQQAGRGSNGLTFGPYPEITLTSAREKRLATRRLILEGINPAEHREESKRAAAEKASNTFEKVAREWHANKLPTWSERTSTYTLRRLELDIFPGIGSRPIHEIKHHELITTLRKIAGRGAHEVAHRLKAVCSQIFSYGIQIGLLERNIAVDMKDVLKATRAGHFAAISTDELPAFLDTINRN